MKQPETLMIGIGRLTAEPVVLKGDMDPGFLNLVDDQFVGEIQPLQYELQVQKLGNEVLVKGVLRLPLQLMCGKCLQFFSTIVEDSSFLRVFAISSEDEEIDITNDVREAVLLELPSYPICSAGEGGRCPVTEEELNRKLNPDGVNPDDRWGDLDNLDLH